MNSQEEFLKWHKEYQVKKAAKAEKDRKKNECIYCKGTGIEHGKKCVMCNGVGFDTKDKDEAICPYCGYGNNIDEPPDDETEWDCANCDKTFDLEPKFSVTYTTRKHGDD